MLRRNFLQLLGLPSLVAAGAATRMKAEPQKRRLFHSVQSGHWDDPLTWDVGEVPTPGSNVILLGHDITVSRVPDFATINCLHGSNIKSDCAETPEFEAAWMKALELRPSYAFLPKDQQ